MDNIRQIVKTVCKALNNNQVEYITIGGFAVIYHGYLRGTADLDFWYRPTLHNFHQIIKALDELNIDTQELKSIVFDPKKTYLRIPALGFRTEFLPVIEGLQFDQAIKESKIQKIDEVEIRILSFEDLIKSKTKANRLKDLLDIEELQKRKKMKDN
jgi:predicted nucleotidyltransferase